MLGQYSPNGLGRKGLQAAINEQSESRIRDNFGTGNRIKQTVTLCLEPDASSLMPKGVHMESKTLSIPNISCEHCVMAIKKKLNEVEGVSRVEGDPTSKSITLDWDAPATLEKIKEILSEINYPSAD